MVPVPADQRAGPLARGGRAARPWRPGWPTPGGSTLRRDLLLRAKGTPPQRRLDARASGSATWPARSPPAAATSAPVILVDDVYTTGATANACSRVLEAVGAGPIVVVTFARALRR